MKTLSTISLVFAMLSACTKPETTNEKKILGEWKFESEKYLNAETLKPPPFQPGYEFRPNNICENKRGFFTTKNNNGKRIVTYLGTETKFKISGNLLEVYSPSSKQWDRKEIVNISKDTLTLLRNDSILIKYSKLPRLVDDGFSFDEIIVAASGCYGSCPVDQVAINRNGNVIFNGEAYTHVIGLHQSQISKDGFNKIEADFKKANVLGLNKRYEASHTDDEEITVTFIKDARIVKTVSDYGGVSPTRFNWAYMPTRYLYQRLKLSKVSPKFDVRNLAFETGNTIYRLPQSESFYLTNLLNNANKVRQNVSTPILLQFRGARNIRSIKTDGRFYRLKFYKGKEEILDLGYNFLSENNLRAKFHTQTEYDEPWAN